MYTDHKRLPARSKDGDDSVAVAAGAELDFRFKDNRLMAAQRPPNWHTRWVTFFLAAAVAASTVYWLLQWPARQLVPRTTVNLNTPEINDTRKVAQLLGGRTTSAPDAAQNSQPEYAAFKLLGVIATGRRSGSALLATDATPAKPYRVGDRVSDGWVLKSISVRSVVLAQGVDAPDGVTLTLPDAPGLR